MAVLRLTVWFLISSHMAYVSGIWFNMFNCGLTTVPPITNPAVDKVNLNQNMLKTIPDDAFKNLTNLEKLKISRNEFEEFPDLGEFKATLEYLFIANNKLTYIDKEIFEGMTNLELLDLNGNPLITFPDISSLRLLETLYINDGHFSQITSNYLPQNNTAFEIFQFGSEYLSNFSITSLYPIAGSLTLLYIKHVSGFISVEMPHDFNMFPSLQNLRINSAELSYFPNVSCSEDLSELRLRENQISTIPVDAFQNLRSLSKFYINANKLSEFPNFGAAKSSLTIVELSSNSITFISDNLVKDMTALEVLDINNNPLTQLPDISSLTSLMHLGIARTYIMQADTSKLPKNITSLKGPYELLSNTSQEWKDFAKTIQDIILWNKQPNVTSLRANDLEAYTQLKTFKVTGSALRTLPHFRFQTSTIEEINLEDNKIEFLNPSSIKALLQAKNLKNVNLNNNALPSFPYVWDSIATIESLKLQQNRFHCDCHMWHLIHQVQLSGYTLPKVDQYPCTTPESLSGVRRDKLKEEDFLCDEKIQFDVFTNHQNYSFRVMDKKYLFKCLLQCYKTIYCESFRFEEGTSLCVMDNSVEEPIDGKRVILLVVKAQSYLYSQVNTDSWFHVNTLFHKVNGRE